MKGSHKHPWIRSRFAWSGVGGGRQKAKALERTWWFPWRKSWVWVCHSICRYFSYIFFFFLALLSIKLCVFNSYSLWRPVSIFGTFPRTCARTHRHHPELATNSFFCSTTLTKLSSAQFLLVGGGTIVARHLLSLRFSLHSVSSPRGQWRWFLPRNILDFFGQLCQRYFIFFWEMKNQCHFIMSPVCAFHQLEHRRHHCRLSRQWRRRVSLWNVTKAFLWELK